MPCELKYALIGLGLLFWIGIAVLLSLGHTPEKPLKVFGRPCGRLSGFVAAWLWPILMIVEGTVLLAALLLKPLLRNDEP